MAGSVRPDPTAVPPSLSRSAPPAAPEGWTTITEGKASITQKAHEVFYNPVQVGGGGGDGGAR